ncbi:MAG: amidophosphoribosyltransferase [Lentisphaeria bacterium]
MGNINKPHEYCGLCGIIGGDKVMEQVYLGLHSLQHRGQEAAGVMIGVGDKCRLHKATGLVDKVFGEIPKEWSEVDVERAISHVRYSTAGGSNAVNAQPLMVKIDGEQVGIAHNGTICNAPSLRKELQAQGAIFQTSTDTELILHLTSRLLLHPCHGDFLTALEAALKRLEGAFCLLLMTKDYTIAVRDPHGFRPLCIGNYTDGGMIVASESIALTVTGADYLREVKPGEMIVWDRYNRMVSRQFAHVDKKAFCIFEHVYFARPGSYVFGDSVYRVRKEMGRQLARESLADVDVIVPVPDSGVYAALGYAEESKIPFDMCLSRNHYVERTFIDPGLISRGSLVRRKLQPIAEALRGKRICLVEDSIVRGSTSLALIKALRDVGVKEVHMRVSCPPHRFGCFFGIDFPERESLLANKVPAADLASTLHLDSLEYLSEEGMLNCVKAYSPENYCCACFDGNYPIKPENLK